MNGLRMMLLVVLTGTALALSGCGKRGEPDKPAAAHTDDDGHDHSDHEDHTGHNH
jgi:predicted small lipoprotein YifL